MDTVRLELSKLLLENLDRERQAEAALADPEVEKVVVGVPEERTSRRGGKRRGAGRKKTGVRRGGPHRRRPELNPAHPVHVTLRIDRRRPELRNHHIYNQVNRVLRTFLGRDDFRVVHLSIQAFSYVGGSDGSHRPIAKHEELRDQDAARAAEPVWLQAVLASLSCRADQDRSSGTSGARVRVEQLATPPTRHR